MHLPRPLLSLLSLHLSGWTGEIGNSQGAGLTSIFGRMIGFQSRQLSSGSLHFFLTLLSGRKGEW